MWSVEAAASAPRIRPPKLALRRGRAKASLSHSTSLLPPPRFPVDAVRLERSLDPLDAEAPAGLHDRDDVEAGLDVVAQLALVRGEPPLGRAHDPPSLAFAHRLPRLSRVALAPRLHLDEGDDAAAPDDEIELRAVVAHVAPQDAPAAEQVVER